MYKNLYFIINIIMVILLSSCSAGSSSGDCHLCKPKPTPPQPVTILNYPVTINSANTIPLVNGSSTTTTISIHNNASYTISGLTYSIVDNSPNISQQSSLKQNKFKNKTQLSVNGNNTEIDPVSAVGCAIIPAGGACSLTIHTAALTLAKFKASFVLTINYVDHGVARVSSQQFNMQYISLAMSESGIVFLNNVSLYPHGNSSAYGSLYYYVSGKNGVSYTIDQEYTNDSNVRITNPVAPGYQATVGSIGVIELETKGVGNYSFANQLNGALSDSFFAYVNVNYSLGTEVRNSSVQANVITNSTGPMLIAGLIPNIDTDKSKQSVMYLTNVGNSIADISNINYVNGLKNDPATTTCQSVLESGMTCKIGFNILTTDGTGDIIVSYNNGLETYGNVHWYGSTVPNLAMTTTPLNLNFYANSDGESYLVSIYNVGTESVYNLVNFQKIIGDASIDAVTPLLCVAADSTTITTPNILPKGYCSYRVTVSSKSAGVGNISNIIGGEYGSKQLPYSTSLNVAYVALDNNPFITLSASTLTPQINGDNLDSQIITVTVSNSGSADAILDLPILNGNNSYFSIVPDSNNCPVSPQTLSSKGACSYQIKFGPAPNVNAYSITGIESSSLTYSGGSLGINTANTGLINYTILPDTQNIVISNVAAFGSPVPSGTGGIGVDAFLMKGYMMNGGVTLTIQNNGSNPMTLIGINDNISPLVWQMNSNTSTCSISSALDVGENCTIVYDYVYNANVSRMRGGSSGPHNLVTPNLIFRDNIGSTYNFQPISPVSSNYFIYANSLLAKLTNVVNMVRSGDQESMVITSVLANAEGYNLPITQSVLISNSSFSYYSGLPSFSYSGSASCSYIPDAPDSIQSCDYNSEDSSSSANYQIYSPYVGSDLDIFTSFTPNSNQQGLEINSLYFVSVM